jgi:hypothetical protein
VTELRLDQKGGRSNAIASVGDMIYMDTRYFDYDESNHMLKSWNKTNPEIENRYLSYGEYLEGWTDTSLENNNRFIWRVRNEYCLFSNRFSNEIFKCSSQNIVNYLRVKSSHFIGSEERQAVSASQDRRTGEPPQSPGRILASMNRYYDIQSYFEEEKHIGFTVMSGSKRHQIVYNKNSGYTKISTGIMKNDRVIKSDYLDTFFLNILQADPEGIFYCAQPEDAARIRTAAREGMLVDGLDRLEELKQLEDFSNPVLFYMKFKDPMR